MAAGNARMQPVPWTNPGGRSLDLDGTTPHYGEFEEQKTNAAGNNAVVGAERRSEKRQNLNATLTGPVIGRVGKGTWPKGERGLSVADD